MKALILILLLLSSQVYSQQVVVAPSEVYENTPQIQPAPLEVDDIPVATERVPLKVQPAIAQVEKIYTDIKASQFFLEVNPLRMAGGTLSFESNNMTAQNNPELEMEADSFNLKLMPLDFKFGFENAGWGSFAEILIQGEDENSEIVVFGKAAGHKIGAGLSLSVSNDELKFKSDKALIATGELKTTEISPYFYAMFELANNENVLVEQWNKIGGVYEKASNDDLTIKGIAFLANTGIDVLFKINSKLQIGMGADFEYQRFSGEVKSTKSNTFKGIADSFAYEFNLIKTRFVF